MAVCVPRSGHVAGTPVRPFDGMLLSQSCVVGRPRSAAGLDRGSHDTGLWAALASAPEDELQVKPPPSRIETRPSDQRTVGPDETDGAGAVVSIRLGPGL